jgi:hypothetical protein
MRHPWTVLVIAVACLLLVVMAAHEHDPGTTPRPPAVSHSHL